MSILAEIRTRRLTVGWRRSTGDRLRIVGTLTWDGQTYEFAYSPAVADMQDFRPLLGFPNLALTYSSTRLFPLFAQRVMDRRRPEYRDYLRALALEDSASALDVLGRSGGRRKGDKLQVLELPYLDPSGGVKLDFLASGTRHIATELGEDVLTRAFAGLAQGDLLELRAEPDNTSNPRALRVTTLEAVPLGYVPDLLLDDVRSALASGEAVASVLRANGPDVAWQLKLVVRLLGS